MRRFFLIFSLCFALLSADESSLLERISYDTDWLYQDILVNGKTIHKGQAQSCPDRFEALKPILDLYDRPIKVLDLGANNGYFSLRIAGEYSSTCVLVDTTDRLRDICSANTDLDNIIYLKERLDVQSLKDLNRREHFDVIIAFHVLHHKFVLTLVLVVLFAQLYLQLASLAEKPFRKL